MDVMRIGQIGRLKPEKTEEYKALHAKVWPEVMKTIKKCHLQNYSIFIKGDYVFSYYEYTGQTYEEDMAKMADDRATQEWWKLTRPCFDKLNEESVEAFYEDMDCIFRLN